MSTPKTAISRWDYSLSYSEFSALMNRQKFIGLRVLPAVSVAQQATNFMRLKPEAVIGPAEDLARAPKTGYQRDTFEWEEDSYATQEYGAEEVVDDRQLAMYGSELRAEAIARDRAINRVALDFETRVAAAVFNTGTWTGAPLTTNGSDWSTPGSGTPILDIDAAREKVITNCGYEPNALILGDDTFLNMVRTDEITDLLKYSGHSDPSRFTLALPQLADLLQIEHIIVARAPMKNTAGRGADASLARIWTSHMAMVARIKTNQDLESPDPAIGCTVTWSGDGGAGIPGAEDEEIGVLVEEYREEARRGGVIRGRTDYQLKILQPTAGHLLTGLNA